MTGIDTRNLIPLIGWLALVVWSSVMFRERGHLFNHSTLPNGVRDALIAAMFCALILGSISAMAFVPRGFFLGGLIEGDIAVFFAAIWRVSVLACGIYALTASVRARNH